MNQSFFKPFLLSAVLLMVLFSCKSKDSGSDATGSFESDEVIVSSQAAGQILSFNLREGDHLSADSVVGKVDITNLQLQKEQVQATIGAIREKTSDATPQIKVLQQQLNVQQAQLKSLQHEQQRIQNLVRQDAATGKQLDDINAQVEVMQRQLTVTRQQMDLAKSNVATQNRSVLSEKNPLDKSIAQINEQIQKGFIVNPINGTVLVKYAEQGEVTAPGKALYKIADLSTLRLRAYITGDQLAKIKLGQTVTVKVDDGNGGFRSYPGTVTWIADEAEFTPKTIQTKDERANLVYAFKVDVKNDGFLKIGMYGEVEFSQAAK